MTDDFRNQVIDDIFTSGRNFLPGEQCSREDVLQHIHNPILVDGLTPEESLLILSTLPKNSDRIFLSPLDKGLSGSKVFAARYPNYGGHSSKLFVFKLGPVKKIEKEQEAIQRFAAPYVPGIAPPVFRRGLEKGLVVQELVGLSVSSKLQSLRVFARNSSKSDEVVRRLFDQRLAGWYSDLNDRPLARFTFKSLFERYLRKSDGHLMYPNSWLDLRAWVRDLTGYDWHKVRGTVSKLLRHGVRSRSCIVHGDLHSQNVLVDETRECWPIDFAWCRDEGSPIIDFVMLECSLKFLSIPRRSALRTLFIVEKTLCEHPVPSLRLAKVPYRDEISNVFRAIVETRRVAFKMGFSFDDYRRALCLMTYTLATHPNLNLPFVLASLQILTAIEEARS